MDIRSLLQSLLDHKVKFLVIGGWALPAYGRVRMTQDIDIFIESTEENARKTVNAIAKVGYDGIIGVPIETVMKDTLLFRDYLLEMDIFPKVKGVKFEDAWMHRKQTTIMEQVVFVPSLDDLLAMKVAANREKDQEDIKFLKEFKRQSENQ